MEDGAGSQEESSGRSPGSTTPPQWWEQADPCLQGPPPSPLAPDPDFQVYLGYSRTMHQSWTFIAGDDETTVKLVAFSLQIEVGCTGGLQVWRMGVGSQEESSGRSVSPPGLDLQGPRPTPRWWGQADPCLQGPPPPPLAPDPDLQV